MYKNNKLSQIEKILKAYGHNTILHYDKWSESHSYQSFGHVQNKKWIAGVHPSELLNRNFKKAVESIITLNEDDIFHHKIPQEIITPNFGDKWGRLANYIEINNRAIAKMI